VLLLSVCPVAPHLPFQAALLLMKSHAVPAATRFVGIWPYGWMRISCNALEMNILQAPSNRRKPAVEQLHFQNSTMPPPPAAAHMTQPAYHIPQVLLDSQLPTSTSGCTATNASCCWLLLLPPPSPLLCLADAVCQHQLLPWLPSEKFANTSGVLFTSEE
jgi:hypothetical protein